MPIPAGSIQIEDTFESFYTWAGEPYDDAAVQRPQRLPGVHPQRHPGRRAVHRRRGRRRRRRRQAIWGGTAGAQFDPCYHLACDTFANNNDHALDVNADAIAFAVLTYAYSTQSVNGVKGKQVPGGFDIPAPAGPEGTVGSGGGSSHSPAE